MSIETYISRIQNRLQKQSKTSVTLSAESALHLYIHLRDVLGMQRQPQDGTNHARLVDDTTCVTFTPKVGEIMNPSNNSTIPSSVTILFRNVP